MCTSHAIFVFLFWIVIWKEENKILVTVDVYIRKMNQSVLKIYTDLAIMAFVDFFISHHARLFSIIHKYEQSGKFSTSAFSLWTCFLTETVRSMSRFMTLARLIVWSERFWRVWCAWHLWRRDCCEKYEEVINKLR